MVNSDSSGVEASNVASHIPGSPSEHKGKMPNFFFSTLAERDVALAERDVALAERDVALAERDVALAELDIALAELDIAYDSTMMQHFKRRRIFKSFISKKLK